MSREDRKNRVLEVLAKGLSASGAVRSSLRDLRERLGNARVRVMDEVVSAIARHPVRTRAELFKRPAALPPELPKAPPVVRSQPPTGVVGVPRPVEPAPADSTEVPVTDLRLRAKAAASRTPQPAPKPVPPQPQKAPELEAKPVEAKPVEAKPVEAKPVAPSPVAAPAVVKRSLPLAKDSGWPKAPATAQTPLEPRPEPVAQAPRREAPLAPAHQRIAQIAVESPPATAKEAPAPRAEAVDSSEQEAGADGRQLGQGSPRPSPADDAEAPPIPEPRRLAEPRPVAVVQAPPPAPPRAPPAPLSAGEHPLPERYATERLVFVARDPEWSFAYWELDPVRIAELKARLLRPRALVRLFEEGASAPALVGEVAPEHGRYYFRTPRADRRYTVDLVLVSAGGDEVVLARSTAVQVPPQEARAAEAPKFVEVGAQREVLASREAVDAPPRLAPPAPEAPPPTVEAEPVPGTLVQATVLQLMLERAAPDRPTSPGGGRLVASPTLPGAGEGGAAPWSGPSPGITAGRPTSPSRAFGAPLTAGPFPGWTAPAKPGLPTSPGRAFGASSSSSAVRRPDPGEAR